jgi:ATP/ADP translocase
VTAAGSGVASEDFFSQLYASVYTSSSIVALLIQSFITSAALRKFGIARVLFVLPVWYLATYGAAAATATAFGITFITGVALQLGERIVIPAIHRPAAELVYSQISAEIRPRARAFLSGGVNAFGNMVAAVALIVGLAAADVQMLLAVGTGLSVVYLYNTFHTRAVFGRRIAENITSVEPDVRRSAAEILRTEHGAVPEELLRSLDGQIPADVEHGVRVALTRRGVLAVAADVTE